MREHFKSSSPYFLPFLLGVSTLVMVMSFLIGMSISGVSQCSSHPPESNIPVTSSVPEGDPVPTPSSLFEVKGRTEKGRNFSKEAKEALRRNLEQSR